MNNAPGGGASKGLYNPPTNNRDIGHLNQPRSFLEKKQKSPSRVSAQSRLKSGKSTENDTFDLRKQTFRKILRKMNIQISDYYYCRK